MAGVEQGSIGKYLKTLEGLGLIERTIPFGDNPESLEKGCTPCAILFLPTGIGS